MNGQPGRQAGEAHSPGTLVCDLSHPPGYDTAAPELRAAFDQAFQASQDARRAYAAAFRDAGGHRGRRVHALFAKYTATIQPLSNARAALTDPAAAAAAVVREAVDALLSIGAWGLHDSNRAEVWTLAIRARRALDGNPMSDEEAARFRASIPARYHDARPRAART